MHIIIVQAHNPFTLQPPETHNYSMKNTDLKIVSLKNWWTNSRRSFVLFNLYSTLVGLSIIYSDEIRNYFPNIEKILFNGYRDNLMHLKDLKPRHQMLFSEHKASRIIL